MVLIIGGEYPQYEAVQDNGSGQWLVLEDGRAMAVGASEADARFLAQAAASRRASLVTPIGPMVVIMPGSQN